MLFIHVGTPGYEVVDGTVAAQMLLKTGCAINYLVPWCTESLMRNWSIGSVSSAGMLFLRVVRKRPGASTSKVVQSGHLIVHANTKEEC